MGNQLVNLRKPKNHDMMLPILLTMVWLETARGLWLICRGGGGGTAFSDRPFVPSLDSNGRKCGQRGSR